MTRVPSRTDGLSGTSGEAVDWGVAARASTCEISAVVGGGGGGILVGVDSRCGVGVCVLGGSLGGDAVCVVSADGSLAREVSQADRSVAPMSSAQIDREKRSVRTRAGRSRGAPQKVLVCATIRPRRHSSFETPARASPLRRTTPPVPQRLFALRGLAYNEEQSRANEAIFSGSPPPVKRSLELR
jgi:hypothetical protein